MGIVFEPPFSVAVDVLAFFALILEIVDTARDVAGSMSDWDLSSSAGESLLLFLAPN